MPPCRRCMTCGKILLNFTASSGEQSRLRRFSGAAGRILQVQNEAGKRRQGPESHWRMFPFRASPSGEQKNGDKMRVIGIDPGLRNLGWGVIDVAGSRLTHVANGICHSDGGDGDLAARLLSLHSQLTEVLRAWQPEAAAVEHTFVNKDAVATLKLGQARGIALLVPAQFGLSVGEYAPNAVKKTVVGVGHAAKVQVDHMVKLHLPGVKIAGADAADALAVAICHAHHVQSSGRLAAALRAAE